MRSELVAVRPQLVASGAELACIWISGSGGTSSKWPPIRSPAILVVPGRVTGRSCQGRSRGCWSTRFLDVVGPADTARLILIPRSYGVTGLWHRLAATAGGRE